MVNNKRIQVYKNNWASKNFDPSVAQNFYSPDSLARQAVEVAVPEYYPEPEPTVAVPIPVVRPKRQRKTKQKTEFAEDIQVRHRHNLLSYVLLFAFFGGLTLILALNARFEYDRLALEAARSQLTALHGSNAARASEIYAAVDLEAIETFAITYLGMQQPEEFQMVEISVMPQSFFAASPQDVPVAGGFSLERFWNILFSFDSTDGQE